MITRPNDWDKVSAFSDRPKIEAGAYECIIKQGAVVKYENGGSQLCILFDIAAGEFTGYYKERFDNDKRADKKWPGILRLWLPKNDGSEMDGWNKSALKGFTNAVEDSNAGYTWDWEEKSLKGKSIGMLFREEEWELDDGRTGITAKPFRALSITAVEDGKYTIPKPKLLKPKAEAPASFEEISGDDGSLPF